MIRKTPSIRLLVVLIAAFPIVLLSVALMGINNHLGHQIEDTMSTALARTTAQQIRQELQKQLVEAERLSDLYYFRFQNDGLPPVPSEQWVPRLYESMLVRPDIASITFAIEDGRTVYVMRVGQQLILGRSDDPTRKQISDYHIDPSGSIDYSKPMNVHRYDPTRRPWYINAQTSAEPKWTDVYAWFLNNQYADKQMNIVGLGYARQLKKNDISGVLLVDIKLDSVSDRLAKSELAKLGTVMMIDDKNRVIARTDTPNSNLSASLVPVSNMNDDDARAITEFIARSDNSNTELKIPHLQRIVQMETINPSSGLNWRLAIALPETGATGQINSMFKQAATIIILVTIVSLAIALWMTHWVTRPISKLAEFTREVGNGNFDQRLDLQSTSEFAQLSEAVNAMTTNLKEQIKLRSEKDAAEQAVQTRNAFFNRVTHELRTPLNAIIGFSEILDESPAIQNDPVARDDLRKLRQASKNLLGLINDLLDLARIDSGGMSVEITLIDLKKFINEIEDITRPLVEKNGNIYRVQCDSDFFIRSDQQKLGQILLNLIANAGKYTNRGTVDVSVLHDKAYVHMRIIDTGKGIPQDKINFMFEPFTRGKSAAQGTGLGLSIARQLTEVLGGEIQLTSEIGKGTCVDLYLPSDPAVVLQEGRNQVVPRRKS